MIYTIILFFHTSFIADVEQEFLGKTSCSRHSYIFYVKIHVLTMYAFSSSEFLFFYQQNN